MLRKGESRGFAASLTGLAVWLVWMDFEDSNYMWQPSPRFVECAHSLRGRTGPAWNGAYIHSF